MKMTPQGIMVPNGMKLGESSATAYRGDRGKAAYDHSQSDHAPSNAQKNSDITKNEIESKFPVTTLGTSGTVTIDRSVSDKFTLTPTASVSIELSNFTTNLQALLIITNGASLVSWNTGIKWDNTDSVTPPTLQESGYDVIRLVCDGSDKYIAEHVGTYDKSVATDYANTGGSGNRTAIIDITTDMTASNTDILINGDWSDGGVMWYSASCAGLYMTFDFGSPKCIQAIRTMQSNFYGFPWSCEFKVRGSNDNSNWTDLHTLTFVNTGSGSYAWVEEVFSPVNNEYYRYYQLYGVSGTMSATGGGAEIQFKIST